jgi:hypothetical protein
LSAAITKNWLSHIEQLEKSRNNLGLETIDVYYVHNPETQLSAVSREEFNSRIEKAFGALEDAVKEGKISVYGVATWNGFRVPPEDPGHLSLSDLVKAAQAAGQSSLITRTYSEIDLEGHLLMSL